MRLFTAIRLSDEARRNLVCFQGYLQEDWVDAPGMKSFRWTTHENLHVTLKFLGDVPDDALEDLTQSLLSIEVQSMRLLAERLDRFPRRGPISVLTARIVDLEAHATHLSEAIASCCEEFGVSRERRNFIPHVTLARSRRGPIYVGSAMGDADPAKFWPGPEWSTANFELMQSTLTPDGPIYRSLKKFGE